VTSAAAHAQVIKKHKNSHQQYVERLTAEGTVTEADVKEVHNRIQSIMQDEFDKAKEYKHADSDWLSSVWTGFMSPAQLARVRNTGSRGTCSQAL
jgi:2-oxoglutarate dehydrogenase E1 component